MPDAGTRRCSPLACTVSCRAAIYQYVVPARRARVFRGSRTCSGPDVYIYEQMLQIMHAKGRSNAMAPAGRNSRANSARLR